MSESNEQLKGSVFDNSYFKNAFNALSEDEKEKYRKIGNYMYGDTSNYMSQSGGAPPAEESIKYIESSLRSGLLPRDLSSEEIYFMKDTFGDKWYKKYGYKKEDC